VSGKKFFRAHKKIAILREHLLKKVPGSTICKTFGVSRSTLYARKEELFRAGLNSFLKRERISPGDDETHEKPASTPDDPIEGGPLFQLPPEIFRELRKRTAPYDAPDELRRTAFIRFGDPAHRTIQFHFKLDEPYPIQIPRSDLNDLGLPEKEHYTTRDVCGLLDLHQDTFRYRLRVGIYPEAKKRAGDKRRFTKEEIREILETTRTLSHKGVCQDR